MCRILPWIILLNKEFVRNFVMRTKFHTPMQRKCLLNVFLSICSIKTTAYECFEDFKSGRKVVDDLPHSGRPLTSNFDENLNKVKEMVLQNRHTTLIELSGELGIELSFRDERFQSTEKIKGNASREFKAIRRPTRGA